MYYHYACGIIYLFIIHYVVPAMAARCRTLLFILYSLYITTWYYLSIYYLLWSTCSGSMCEASCGSMMPAIIIFHLFFINQLLVSACIRQHASAAARCLILIFDDYLMIYYLLFSAWRYSGAGGGAGGWSEGPHGEAHGCPQGPPSGAESCGTFVSHTPHCHTRRTAAHSRSHCRSSDRLLRTARGITSWRRL
jgi:hypothetical protein